VAREVAAFSAKPVDIFVAKGTRPLWNLGADENSPSGCNMNPPRTYGAYSGKSPNFVERQSSIPPLHNKNPLHKIEYPAECISMAIEGPHEVMPSGRETRERQPRIASRYDYTAFEIRSIAYKYLATPFLHKMPRRLEVIKPAMLLTHRTTLLASSQPLHTIFSCAATSYPPPLSM